MAPGNLTLRTPGVRQEIWDMLTPAEGPVLFPCRIDNALTIEPLWLRLFRVRTPATLMLRTGRSFPPSHPTTNMCLRLILALTESRHCRHLVDVGCGSGVLALAALKLGVKWAVGLDLSPAALAVSKANAELNKLEQRLFFVQGSTEALAATFDLVVANLPMPVLLDKMPELARLAGFSAPLILSGFQDLDRPRVEQALRKWSYNASSWLNADLSFFGPPPSGSYTWMATLALVGEEHKVKRT
jgi:ribosomal protein L11 methylase PrmA